MADTPEERVRQRLLQQMLSLGYPRSYLVVEKQLKELPHVVGPVPDRRIDLACFYSAQGELAPLITIECKAVPITRKVIDQVIGYNHYVGAPFIGVANEEVTKVGYLQGAEYVWVEALPAYQELVANLTVSAI